MNRGVSPLSGDSDHFWREHPPKNGTGSTWILGPHYKDPGQGSCWRVLVGIWRGEAPAQFRLILADPSISPAPSFAKSAGLQGVGIWGLINIPFVAFWLNVKTLTFCN